MVNKALIRPAISGGGTLGGGWLNSHKSKHQTLGRLLGFIGLLGGWAPSGWFSGS